MHPDRTAETWKKRYKPIADWDRMFAQGEWDYLDGTSEAARYALIAGYVHRLRGPAALLDVGCGAGVLCQYLDRSRVSYTGIDVSETAIAQARERFPESRFGVSDLAQYEPANGQKFDVVVFNEVLPHVDDPLGSLRRYLSFLLPSGLAVISTYQNTDRTSNASMFTDLLKEAVASGRFRSCTGCEVVTFEKGLKWRIDVLTSDEAPDAQD